MIWHVARRELLENVRSVRFLAVCLLALVLLPLSAHVNIAEYEARLGRIDALRLQQQQRMAERVTESASYASRYGWRGGETIADPALRALRPPTRLSVLAMGAESSTPMYWQFGTEGLDSGPAAASRAGADGTGVDAVFVVQTVLGLLALLLVFDTISGERESGVLRLLLAAPVRRADLLLGKTCGAALTLGIPLVLGLSGALAVAELEGVSLLRDGALVRLGIFAGASALYLLYMLALGVAVSAATSRPRTTWVALLLLWTGLVLAYPRTAEMVAVTAHPSRPAFEARQSKAAAIRQLEAERARTLSGVWRRVSGADSAAALVPPPLRLAYRRASARDEAALIERKRSVIATVDRQHAREGKRQRRLVRALGWVSPASAYAAVAVRVAGTGPDAAEHWADQAAVHQGRLEAATFDRTFGMEIFPEHLRYLRIVWWPDLGDPADRPPDYSALPVFAYRPPPLSSVLADVVPEMSVLAVGAIGWLLVAMLTFQRADLQ